jgi:glycosyltransferase involved in cell wall biosynthesis
MKIVLFANTDWYLFNFRLGLARELRSSGHEVVFVCPAGKFGERIRDAGFRWVPIRMNRRSINPLGGLLVIFRLAKVLRREQPALLHCFTVKCVLYGGLAARMAGDVPRINAIAGLGYVFSSEDVLAKLLRPMVKGVLSLALNARHSWAIVQNSSDAEILCDKVGARKERVSLIPSSGVDCARFAMPHRTQGDASQPLRIVLAARLLKSKGVQEFAEAARILRDKRSNVAFFLAGEPDPGNPESIQLAIVQSWAQAGILSWLGHVDDVAPLFRDVDVMALPSYYGEGLPRALVEAAASGLALISTDMPGCRDAVVDGVTGLIVPPRNVEALVQAIEQLEADRHRTWQMGAAAAGHACGHFDMSAVNEKTIATYRALLATG